MPTTIVTKRNKAGLGTAILAALPLFALIVALIVGLHGGAAPYGADAATMNWTTF